jgi:hypothetical protein
VLVRPRERLMLTRIAFAAHGVPALVFGSVVAIAVQVMPGALAPAQAGGVLLGCTGDFGGTSCAAVWGPGGDPYIRKVPAPRNAEEQAQYDAREHKWVERCHPVIRQDQYGVARYHYTAPGCEFGVIGD